MKLFKATTFRDRHDAGEQLAERLVPMELDDPIVLALPRGGVPVAFEIARRLGAQLDVFVARKIGAPGQPEYGIGAIAEGGTVVARDGVLAMLQIDDRHFARLVETEREELDRRVHQYRAARPLPDLRRHDVVLVDDGLATGVTAQAAAIALRAAGSRRLVLAVPVCAVAAAEQLAAIVDEVVCVLRPRELSSVGQWYVDFSQTSDAEVLALLGRAHADQEGTAHP